MRIYLALVRCLRASSRCPCKERETTPCGSVRRYPALYKCRHRCATLMGRAPKGMGSVKAERIPQSSSVRINRVGLHLGELSGSLPSRTLVPPCVRSTLHPACIVYRVARKPAGHEKVRAMYTKASLSKRSPQARTIPLTTSPMQCSFSSPSGLRT